MLDSSSSFNIQRNQSINPVPSVQTSVPQTTLVQPTPETQNKNYWKLLVVVLLIILVGMSALVFYFWQKTITSTSEVSEATPTIQPKPTPPSNDTTNWKTYQENNTPYSFKYPKEMIAAGAGPYIVFSYSDSAPFLNYNFEGNKENKSLDQFVASYIASNNDPVQPVNQFKSKNQITINGIPGYKADISNTRYYFLKEPNTHAVAVFTYLLNADQNSQKTFDQIISTFKFTDQTKTNKENLKTYSNSTYTYTFNYPQSWKVTTEDFNVPATPTSKKLQIFNPEDKPEEGMYSGMTIEYVGMVQNLTGYQKTTLNGIEMYMLNATHGVSYYVVIPDTDQYLHITGAGGNSPNEESNQTYRQIFSTFKFTR